MGKSREEVVENVSERKLIMLVEDDEEHASVLYQLLAQEEKYRVYYTSDGQTAWKFLQYFKPHLLLLDYRLPRMDGLELYDRIRADKELYDIPVLMVSAALPAQAVEQRGIASLEKPFEMDELLSTIDTLITAP
jgi:two-component system alkaline phosphatase synthesis response regulator PhoP